jgi:5-methylcytosine-specific restriction endonuclease McrA
LATAHLDNNPGHNDQKKLKALCQRCHIIVDRPEHLRRRRLNFLMTRALGDLFEGRNNVV